MRLCIIYKSEVRETIDVSYFSVHTGNESEPILYLERPDYEVITIPLSQIHNFFSIRPQYYNLYPLTN